MNRSILMLLSCCATSTTPALSQVQRFFDYQSFANAAGPLSVIDFETLPDGIPTASNPLVHLTPTFNYDDWGAHFSAPLVDPQFGFTAQGTGYSLIVNALSSTHFDIQLTNPEHAIGIFFPGATTLTALDAFGVPIGSISAGSSGFNHFAGLVSPSVPIASVTVNRGSFAETLDSFMFSPIPEPGTAALLLLAGAGIIRRKRR